MVFGKLQSPRMRRRAMVASLAILLITVSGVFTAFSEPPAEWRAVDVARVGAFLLLALVLSSRATTSFSLVGRNSVLDDELTRANRLLASRAGFWAMIFGVIASFVGAMFTPLTVAQVAPLVLAVGVVAAVFRFALLERQGDA